MSHSQPFLPPMSTSNPITNLGLCAPDNRWFDAIHHAVSAPTAVLLVLAFVCVIAHLRLRYAISHWAVVVTGAAVIGATLAGGASLVVFLATC